MAADINPISEEFINVSIPHRKLVEQKANLQHLASVYGAKIEDGGSDGEASCFRVSKPRNFADEFVATLKKTGLTVCP